MIPNRNHRLKASFLFAGMLALCAPVHAKDAPEITPSLKKMLHGLPIAGIKDDVQGMIASLEKTTCGNNLTGCYMTKSGPLQLYFFTSGTSQQTLLLVVDKSLEMPAILSKKVQDVLGQTSVSTPMISISTTDYNLDVIKMPQALRDVVRDKYFNMNSLTFSSGVQVAARANVGGAFKLAMASLGADVSNMLMRAAVVMPIPTDLAGGAGTGAAAADAVAHGETMKKAGADALSPEAFVEFQFGPGSMVKMGMPQMRLTDATFFINNALTFGYKGNAYFSGAKDKKVLMQFQTPLTPAGYMDLADFSFRMATPTTFTMEDAAHVMVAMASPDPRLKKHGGGFIKGIDSFKGALLTMVKPLSAMQMRNPNPAPDYVFGDNTKPFPTDNKYFNFLLLGPLADNGPLMYAAGNVKVLGQEMGWLQASAGLAGLNAEVGRAITLKIGPLGKVNFNMAQSWTINQTKQEIAMMGNIAGQKIEVGYGPTNMRISVNSTCVNPFEINGEVAIVPTTNLSDVFDAHAGVNVDPSKIQGCIGAQLEAAYKKIAGEYKNLSGYTAAAANAELKKIANAAAAAEAEAKKQAEAAANEAKKQAEAAQREYNKTKDAVRNVANSSTSAANKAFNDAGNAFKKLGKKKKRKPAPDIRFAASVFDWDFYYDNAPDVVKAKVDLSTHWRDNGFQEGRQGSPEFGASFYWHRYTDVQSLCKLGDRLCVTNHWLNYGIEQGRQGSAGFSLHGYMDRYTDLQNAFGQENYEAAIDHWFDNGEDEGRSTQATIAGSGPVSGPARVGGGGGGAWSDMATCKNQQVTGFRIGAGRLVDRVQFKYPSGWAPRQGGGNGWNVDVTLPNGQYIVRVDYRNGSMVDQVSFTTNTGVKYGPYGGGGGSPGVYTVTPGEKLGCMRGRAGSSMDRLTFTSTGPR